MSIFINDIAAILDPGITTRGIRKCIKNRERVKKYNMDLKRPNI